ncbi:MAG: hypothetical protein RLZZ241_1538 [Bacteroidota bacterium]|jgi:ketosteroid isomerase-like protein
MKHLVFVFLTGLFCSGCTDQTTNNTPKPMENQQSLQAANNQFYDALNIMFTGDVGPVNAVWSHEADITYMGPFGGMHSGWEQVGAEFANVAALKIGGSISCENLEVRVLGDVGYTLCVEAGENLDNEGNPVPVRHRATNVFRKENGVWKLVHHHTDISGQLQESTGISE